MTACAALAGSRARTLSAEGATMSSQEGSLTAQVSGPEFFSTDPFAPRDLFARSLDPGESPRIQEKFKGVLECLEVFGTHQYRRRSPISSERDPFVLGLDPIHDLREPRLDLGERQGCS
jgi:hypothetical protein